MPQENKASVENNFTKGLITEFTGLNFPENAATDCDNTEFSLVGDVSRRLGMEYEDNYITETVNKTNSAMTTYKWKNAGGDGSTEIVVSQVAGRLYFYVSSAATAALPLSNHLIPATFITLTTYLPTFSTFGGYVTANECTFSDGNGYLFVYHPYLEPFYVYYNVATGIITAGVINVQTRDFTGVIDNTAVDTRPGALTDAHNYNLHNQGWTNAVIAAWFAAIANYPSNADVWWTFKNAAGNFDPTTIVPQRILSAGPAPKGHYVLSAFDQQRGAVSTIPNLTSVSTFVRPTNGAWFQGRVWYTGVNATSAGGTTQAPLSWSETIYFTQIIQTPEDFGKCYQANDPTSETLFDLLPTDGGVIQIQGCGQIYKLFPLQNALLVFTANGIYYITGSQGIGFSATDYTIYELSKVRTLSNSSFVSVHGYPYFWNEEGIYSVEPTKQDNAPDARRNALEVNPITVGTILSFYDQIPLVSKKTARGVYDPIEYVIKWIYRDTEYTNGTEKYEFDRILNFNTYNKAFFPYSISSDGIHTVNSILYVSSPGNAVGAPEPAVKYFASNTAGGTYEVSFAELRNEDFLDWGTTDFNSYFVTGYKLHGQGQRRFQIPYVYVYSRADEPTSYKIQGLWDYATSGNSGRWSTAQLVRNWSPNFGMLFRRHRIRGQGLVLQLKVTSVEGEPFDIMGWSAFETLNTGA